MKIISKKTLNYLEPLVNWRVLNLDNLTTLNMLNISKKGLSKAIQKVEKLGIVDSFTHPLSRKKYIYLTALGETIIGNINRASVKDQALFHDAMISEFLFELNKIKPFKSFRLEEKSSFDNQNDMKPDAEFWSWSDKYLFELELTQKSRSRIKKKIKDFFREYSDPKLLYIFPRRNLLDNYQRALEEEFNYFKNIKVGLFYLPSLYSRVLNLSDCWGTYQGEKIHLLEFLDLSQETIRRHLGGDGGLTFQDSS